MTRRTRPNKARRALAARGREARRASLRNLIDRAGRVTLTPLEADTLRTMAEAEFAESDALRATVGGQQSANNRHKAQLDAAHDAIREAEQHAAEWKTTAATYSGLHSSAEQDAADLAEQLRMYRAVEALHPRLRPGQLITQAFLAEQTAPLTTPERCGAWGGCTLPRGHNTGRADVPGNHDIPLPTSTPEQQP